METKPLIDSKSKSKELPAKDRAFRSRPEDDASIDTRTYFCGADLQQFLKSPAPLVVEIGCGVGLHPIQYATEFPQKNVVAIERTSEKFARFKGRIDHHPELHRNLCAVHADAVHFIDQTFVANSIDEVWILYPNPEMKKTSRRWFLSPFMSRLIQLMKPGASLYFATNLEDYAKEALQVAGRHQLQVAASKQICLTSHPDWKPRTHFEKKYHERGETLFDIRFKFEPSGVSL